MLLKVLLLCNKHTQFQIEVGRQKFLDLKLLVLVFGRVMNLPRTYEKLTCKEEPYRFTQTEILLLYFKDF